VVPSRSPGPLAALLQPAYSTDGERLYPYPVPMLRIVQGKSIQLLDPGQV
jgi:hypothetical protein